MYYITNKNENKNIQRKNYDTYFHYSKDCTYNFKLWTDYIFPYNMKFVSGSYDTHG